MNPAALLTEGPLALETAVGNVRFKVRANVEQKRLHAYSIYAHYLAMLVLESTSDLPRKEARRDADAVRGEITSEYGELNLANALNYIWDLGIPVLPLHDPGAFHAACWRAAGRDIVVLKQKKGSLSRWLFDLLHEFWHTGQKRDEVDRMVLQGEGMLFGVDQDEEEEANLFAGDVMLKGRAEELAKLCVEAAKGKVEYLKSVVPRVALSEGVSSSALANYMAFRLGLQKINWWGTAENLQERDEDPFHLACGILMARTDFSKLSPPDRELLLQATSNGELDT